MGRLVGTHSPCAPERKEGAACLQFAVTFSFYCGRPNNENGDDAMAPSVGSVSFPISQQRNQSIWTTLHPTFCVCCCAYSLLLLLSPPLVAGICLDVQCVSVSRRIGHQDRAGSSINRSKPVGFLSFYQNHLFHYALVCLHCFSFFSTSSFFLSLVAVSSGT